METDYPQDPASIPDDLTKPNASYKRQAWIAMGGLLSFIALYFFLSFWFAYNAYQLTLQLLDGPEKFFWTLLLAFINLVLAIFMLKALIFRQKIERGEDHEVTEKEEPRLFAFLHQLADNAGAPRPHKVYLSNRVNASVSYDLSILNLLFPSKKNLEIGLGLVNVLNVGELKAVLAHEFGHFAQRSMLIGRWVYISQQIATYLIAQRDALDKLLAALSQFDLRVAWIGWILSIIIWSIRSLVETCFNWVILAQRALSREMEFHADLVAVSLTGSDALIHALHKLSAADQAFDEAVNFADRQLGEKAAVPDLYSLQANLIKQWRNILNNPDFGASPTIPQDNPAAHRVFQSKIATPPKMWSTHPADNDREENAKKTYIPNDIDSRDSWSLFSNPDQTRKELTEQLLKTAKVAAEKTLSIEESLELQNKEFNFSYLDPKYRGVYLGRSPYLRYENIEAVYLDMSEREAMRELPNLYPESLRQELEEVKSLEEEVALLKALKNRTYTAPGGIIRHRGEEVSRRDLPELIEQVTAELKEVEDKIARHDQLARSVHLALAKKMGNEQQNFLKGLAQILHYAEHTQADLNDAYGKMNNVFQVVIADGRVTSSERTRLINACNELHDVLFFLHKSKEEIVLPPAILKSMKSERWAEALGKFDLVSADPENIDQWLKVIDGWVASANQPLSQLHDLATEELLKAEEQVASKASSSVQLQAIKVPEEYTTLLPGNERELQTKLNAWERFQLADGLWPTIARLAVACVIIGTTIAAAEIVGASTVYIYNGLANNVEVEVNGSVYEMNAWESEEVMITDVENLVIRTRLASGELIEQFKPQLGRKNTNYVYNIARAGSLLEYTVYYGAFNFGDQGDRYLGAKRWMSSKADFIFEEAPNSINTNSAGGSRSVLSSSFSTLPSDMISETIDEKERKSMILAHAQWDGPNSENIITWLDFAAAYPEFSEMIAKRLQRNPSDVIALRAQTDYAEEAEKEKICNEYTATAEKNPDNPDYHYLYCRCMEDGPIQDSCFIEGARNWPEHGWLAFASGYVAVNQHHWNKAIGYFEVAATEVPALSDNLAVQLERIIRLQGEGIKVNFEPNGYLEYLMFLEDGTDLELKESAHYAYHLLHTGQISQARSLDALQNDELLPSIQRLLAVSDGATEQMVLEALELSPDEGIDINTVWSAIGLASRERGNWRSYEKSLDSLLQEQSVLAKEAIDHAIAGNFEEAEAVLMNFNIFTNAQVRLIGSIQHGLNAPPEWRAFAKDALFAVERPYLRATIN